MIVKWNGTHWVDTLGRAHDDAGECDLIAKTRIFGAEAGFLYVGGGFFQADQRALPPLADAALRSVPRDRDRPVTYTCVPPGSGVRLGIDRDGDGAWDGDERLAHSDPADPRSRP